MLIPRIASEKMLDGTLKSRNYEDMFPYIPKDELNNLMIAEKEQFMKVIVTGATSMIRVALIEKCISKGIEVLAICRKNQIEFRGFLNLI